MQFWQLSRLLFAKSPICVRTKSENDKKNLFFAEILFHKTFLKRRKLQVWETWWKPLPKDKNVYAQNLETIIFLYILSRKKNFLQPLIWTRRMRFWQLSRILFAKSPTCFCTNSKNDKKSSIFAENLHHRTFLMRRKLQFWETCQKSLPKVRKVSAQSVETIKKYTFFQKKVP